MTDMSMHTIHLSRRSAEHPNAVSPNGVSHSRSNRSQSSLLGNINQHTNQGCTAAEVSTPCCNLRRSHGGSHRLCLPGVTHILQSSCSAGTTTLLSCAGCASHCPEAHRCTFGTSCTSWFCCVLHQHLRVLPQAAVV
jgi:hypothetical protein